MLLLLLLLVEPVRSTHSGLDVQGPDVLPVLLEQGDQKVDRGRDVDVDLLLGHVDVADGDAQAQDLLSWNLMLFLTSATFSSKLSLWVTKVGNLPALFKPGPNKRGICLMMESEAKKPWYFLASFFTSFLFFFSFFKASTSMQSRPMALASSQCWASPRRQNFMRGLGKYGSLTVPLKRLSFWGS